jgi:hypothetical protein
MAGGALRGRAEGPFSTARGPRPSTVGGGNDVTAGVTTGHISTAGGSFDSVSGVTSVTSQFGSDDYSLQLNANLFSSPICSGAGTPSQCQGWQQFIYSNDQCTNGGVNECPLHIHAVLADRLGKHDLPRGLDVLPKRNG